MFPKRGAVALAVTAVALVLLLSFKTPDQLVGDVERLDGHRRGCPGGRRRAPTTAGDGARGRRRRRPTRPPTRPPRPTRGRRSPARASTPASAPSRSRSPSVGGQITDVAALQLPSGGRSGRISRAVEPILREEALQAQSANIDTVSGATYTSLAYAQSLQAALDQAGI